MLVKRRIPIALRLFLTVLLTTLLITTLSLGVLHWTMQKNFAQYVADVELQKLDHLANNLGSVYAVYHDWGNAIQAQILQIEGDAGPDDYDRLSRGWLRRQYDIALQQRYFKEQTLINQTENATDDEALKVRPVLSSSELAIIQQNLPSQYQPFEGLRFPLNANRNLVRRLDQAPSSNSNSPRADNALTAPQAQPSDAATLTQQPIQQPARNPLLPPDTPAAQQNTPQEAYNRPPPPQDAYNRPPPPQNGMPPDPRRPPADGRRPPPPNGLEPPMPGVPQEPTAPSNADVNAPQSDARLSAASNPQSQPAVTVQPSLANTEAMKKQFISLPDRLGLSSRLALYDSKKRFVVGEPAENGVSFRPIMVKNEVVGYLGLKPVLDQKDALSINFFSQQKRYLLLIYAISLIVSLIAALLLATYFKTPIQRLLHATKVLARGNFKHQVAIKRNDELGDLSQQLNKLANMLHQHEQSRRQWVADTSHELKTPLAVLQAQIEAVQDGIRQATPEHLQSMMSQVQSLKKLTQDLSDLAQADAQQLRCYLSLIDPWPLIQQELAHFQAKFDQAQLSVSSQGRGCILPLDADRLRQIVVNLFSNSVRYTLPDGKIQISTEHTAQYWRLYIDDSPLGLTDTQLLRLGERFYRADDSRARVTGGTGLGLALSCKLAQAMGGQLRFAHSPLGGLRAELTFYFNNTSPHKEAQT